LLFNRINCELMAAVAKRSKSRGGDTAAALRAAGLALFADRGFEGASTHAIAERAGLRQGLIRYHFGSKEGLWREVVAQGATELSADLSTDGDTRAQLGQTLPPAASEHRRFIQVVCHALLEPGARREWLIGELAARLRPHTRALLASASRGRARSQDEDVTAWMWLGAAVAMAAFTPALERARGAALDRERALRVERALLAGWLSPESVAPTAGPWSIAAAARRRQPGPR
jgi:AcrR family transcriptional regulator